MQPTFFTIHIIPSLLLQIPETISSSSGLQPSNIIMSLLPASDASIPTSKQAQEVHEICEEGYENFCIRIEGLNQSKRWDFIEPATLDVTESPRSMMGKEKQISVDPISLKQTINIEGDSLSVPPITTWKNNSMHPPPPLPPTKPKFISYSLPSSETSSPRSASALMKSLKKWRNQSHASLIRQHTAVISRFAVQGESHLRRSKSCGEGRANAPSDEFDLWARKSNADGHENGDDGSYYECQADDVGTKSVKESDPYEEGFKCGALCLFLPGFGKGKPVKERKDDEAVEVGNVISRTVSLEKFECGSWSSSAIINGEEEDDHNAMQHYFDLPLELIRNCVNDANSPVKTAFIFDRGDQKGVLKKNTSRAAARKSHESPRHVRFSPSSLMSYPTSPSSCITPRLRKAREDFNAYLEAQSA